MKGNRRRRWLSGRIWISLLTIVALLTPMFSTIALAEDDADYEAAGHLDLSITPVPGGVGTVTSSVLMRHVIEAAESLR